MAQVRSQSVKISKAAFMPSFLIYTMGIVKLHVPHRIIIMITMRSSVKNSQKRAGHIVNAICVCYYSATNLDLIIMCAF